MSRTEDLLVATDRGLFCAAGGFYIDPWRPVDRAVVTHAHSDHAVWGCGGYLASPTGAEPLRERVGPAAPIERLPWGERRRIGDVLVSVHPAGHILGSAQIRVEGTGAGGARRRGGGGVWVVSGDYKVQPDPTCEAFEPVACDVFITESTFGLPVYRWPRQETVFEQVNAWWRQNREAGRTSVVFAYALGKAQRVLAGLDPSIGPIGVHGAVERMNAAYRRCGIALPSTVRAVGDEAKALRGVGMIVAPPSADSTPWLRKFGETSTAFASGWMAIRGTRRRRALDRGFVVSDHADWEGLHWAIRETGASRIGVTHGYTEAMVRWLREQGREAWVVPTRWEGGEEGEEQNAGEAGAVGEGDAAATP